MSVGLLAARSERSFVRGTLPLAAISIALALLVSLLYEGWADRITVSFGDQQAPPQLVYFGSEYRPADPGRWVVPIWAVAGAFFALIALTFVGLGQVMGRAFHAIPDRVAAYTIDILGSLAGIAAFAAMSYFHLPPSVWYLPVVFLVLYFAGWRSLRQTAAAAATLALVAVGAHGLLAYDTQVFWSPYYKVALSTLGRVVSTNHITHQEMVSIGRAGPAYTLPHLLNRDAGGAPFDDILIIGAGTGNDVAAALRYGVKRVDAVEIDPSIGEIGRRHHPDRPYADPRVSVRLDDGRSFLRRTEHKYDLAVYALVDSLVLHSGYSSLRLENFLFTREAFEDVKRALKPGGVFAMYNFYREGWVVGRLARTAEEVFGAAPLVINLPYRGEVRATDREADAFTFILVGTDSARLQALRRKFDEQGNFWMNMLPAHNEGINAFRAEAPDGAFFRGAPSRVEAAGAVAVPSDDWPQLYLREPMIPWAPIGQGMLVIAVLSAVILLGLAAPRRARLNWQMFFLGAGFMLLETKGVVHMALLFGSTWAVNSVVFGAILVMIVCANLFVLKAEPRNLLPWYALLVAALLVNALVPMNAFLSLPPVARTLASCAVVFVPIFFAGVIFATAFSRSREPGVDFGSNVAGVIAGGLSEQLSLVVGFNYLLLVAIAFYLLSLVLRRPA